MDGWKRELIRDGFVWTNDRTGTRIISSLEDNRWTAMLCVLLASGEIEKTRFFTEDGYGASLQKCLLYIWRALSLSDKSTFDLEEALADLGRFAL